MASAICGALPLPKPFTRVVAPSQVHKENFKFFSEGVTGGGGGEGKQLKLKLDVGVLIAPLFGACALCVCVRVCVCSVVFAALLTLIAWHFSHISAAHFVQNLIILTELFAAFGAL